MVLKIILMYPNFKWLDKWEESTTWKNHPYNLCILSAMIEKKYDVRIIDVNKENLSKEEFTEIIKFEKPDVLGISVPMDEFAQCGLIAAEIAKKVNPSIKTVFGGVNAISNPDPVIKNEFIDYVVVGESEHVLPKLCDHFNGEENLPEKGIIYKKNGQIINTGRTDFIENLDDLPLPSYHKINFMKYTTEIQRESVNQPRELPYAHIITSRGCPFNCCFCQVGTISGKKTRVRSPENIIKEIEYLINNYGVKTLIFDDDNLLIFRDRAKKLFELMIEKQFNLKWISLATAVFKMDEELIELMKKSGCQYVNISIESGVERVLKDIIHKPINLEQAKRMTKKLKEVGIDVAANFIVGFPGETWSEIRQTIKFAEELDADYTKIFTAVPLPHTELYQIAKKEGALIDNFDPNKHLWTDGCIQTSEFRPQDLKILRAYEWDRINFTNPKKKKNIARMMSITEERLDEIRKKTLFRANP